MKKKKIMLGVILIVFIPVAIWGVCTILDYIVSNQLEDDAIDDNVACFILGRDNMNEITIRDKQSNGLSGTNFIVDTGSTGNSITQETFNKFIDNGYTIKKIFLPCYMVDALGNTHITFWKYLISIPILKTDMNGNVQDNNIVTFKNILFTIRDSNILGIDFLKHYYIEFFPRNEEGKRYIALRKSQPEGYNNMIKLKKFNWDICDYWGLGSRYYIDMKLGETSRLFFLDSGKIFIVHSKQRCVSTIVIHTDEKVETKCMDTTWLERENIPINVPIQDYIGKKKDTIKYEKPYDSYYCIIDNNVLLDCGIAKIVKKPYILYESLPMRTKYAIDPFSLFGDYAFVLDFKHSKLYLQIY